MTDDWRDPESHVAPTMYAALAAVAVVVLTAVAWLARRWLG